jgi:hypothetical protein
MGELATGPAEPLHLNAEMRAHYQQNSLSKNIPLHRHQLSHPVTEIPESYVRRFANGPVMPGPKRPDGWGAGLRGELERSTGGADRSDAK